MTQPAAGPGTAVPLSLPAQLSCASVAAANVRQWEQTQQPWHPLRSFLHESILLFCQIELDYWSVPQSSSLLPFLISLSSYRSLLLDPGRKSGSSSYFLFAVRLNISGAFNTLATPWNPRIRPISLKAPMIRTAPRHRSAVEISRRRTRSVGNRRFWV